MKGLMRVQAPLIEGDIKGIACISLDRKATGAKIERSQVSVEDNFRARNSDEVQVGHSVGATFGGLERDFYQAARDNVSCGDTQGRDRSGDLSTGDLRAWRHVERNRVPGSADSEPELTRRGIVAIHPPLDVTVRKLRHQMNAQGEDARTVQRGFDGRVIFRAKLEHGDAVPILKHLRPLVEEKLEGVAGGNLQRELIAHHIDVADLAAHHRAPS